MKIILSIFTLVFMLSSANAEDLVEFDYELDAYYSNVSAFIDLDSDKNVTDATNYSEARIYKELVLNTFNPNIFLLEASIHPMSLGGLYIRKHHETTYGDTVIQDNNMIKSLTAGFEEPYSLSFFFGRMMVFTKKNTKYIGKNRAYIGYLLTIGDYSIKDNVAHYDKWYNIEFKFKGTRNKKNRDLDWSFRVGSRIHENNNFTDTLFVGARRSSTDYKRSPWSLLYNSAYTVLVSADSKTLKLTDTEILLEKKWPLDWGEKVSFGLIVGYIYTSEEKYKNELREEGIDKHQFVLRPNLTF